MAGSESAFAERNKTAEEERKAVLPVKIYHIGEVALYRFSEAFASVGRALYAPFGEFHKSPVAASKAAWLASNKDRLYSESNPSPAPYRVAESNPSPAPQRLTESNPSPAPYRVAESNPSPAPYRVAESNPSPAPAAILYALEFLGVKPTKVAESNPSPAPRKKV